MKKEEKDLLLKDLSSRLPYGVKFKTPTGFDTLDCIDADGWINAVFEHSYVLEEIKPYLFPLSSMTAEQEMECQQIKHSYYYDDDSFVLFDWYDKNHIDYRGLIPKGLAIDATGLNIY